MTITLRSIDPFSPALLIKVESLPAVVGRNGQSDVCVNNKWISNRHCELFEQDGQIFICDHRSQHGVSVNGKRVKQSVLNSGDELTLGIRVFEVRCPESADSSDAASPGGGKKKRSVRERSTAAAE